MQKHKSLLPDLLYSNKSKVSLKRAAKQRSKSVQVGNSSLLNIKELELTKVRRSTKPTISPKPVKIWHLDKYKCETCNDILQFKIEDINKLQHHFKFCTTYSIYFPLIALVEGQIGKDEDKKFIEENPSITYPKRAQSVCKRAGQKWKNIKHEFSEAAELSNQLIRPDQSENYDCDNYENHLRWLHVIAQNIKGAKEIVKEIENALLPYNQPSSSEKTLKRKWEKTFANIKHKINDDQLIETLRKIVRNRTVIPEIYLCSCHKE